MSSSPPATPSPSNFCARWASPVTPGVPFFSRKYAFGLCHVLTCALLKRVGGGEALGLYVGTEVVHSLYRLPHTNTFLDGHGVTENDLPACAARYLRNGEKGEWKALTQESLEALAAGGNRSRLSFLIREATPTAREILTLT